MIVTNVPKIAAILKMDVVIKIFLLSAMMVTNVLMIVVILRLVVYIQLLLASKMNAVETHAILPLDVMNQLSLAMMVTNVQMISVALPTAVSIILQTATMTIHALMILAILK